MRCTIYIVCDKADICVSDIDFIDVNLVKTGLCAISIMSFDVEIR